MHVYFIQNPTTRRVKIGTSVKVGARLRALEAQAGQSLILLGVVPGSQREEKALHARFQSARCIGEWFELTPELKRYIQQNAKPFKVRTREPTKSTRLVFRLSPDVRRMAEELASHEGASMSRLIRTLLVQRHRSLFGRV